MIPGVFLVLKIALALYLALKIVLVALAGVFCGAILSSAVGPWLARRRRRRRLLRVWARQRARTAALGRET